MEFRLNNKYRIKSPSGYSNFSGVVKKTTEKLYTIVFEDGTSIRCAKNHVFLTDVGFLLAEQLTPQNTLTGKTVKSISFEVGYFDVFDPVEVEDHHTYYSADVISHNTEFLGSTNTLISADKLQTLVGKTPVYHEDFVDIFQEPIENRTYALVADVSEGLGKDYSTFSVFDITQIPYVQVMKYQNSDIKPMMFPTIIYATAKKYNEAFVLIEINNIGLQVADILHHDLEYENLLKIKNSGRNGQEVSEGFTTGIQNGLKTSKQSKRIGCTNLKTLIESDKLIVQDEDTIFELKTFSENKGTWAAEDGNHDDLVMTLVNFSWLVSQKTFKTRVDTDIRKVLQEEQFNIHDTDLVPFGIIDDGREEKLQRDQDGDLWFEDRTRVFPFDDFAWDPYGRF